jgi:trehalose 6-phosphate phosphatase
MRVAMGWGRDGRGGQTSAFAPDGGGGGHTRPVPTTTELTEALRPLVDAPQRAAIFLDVDGTLAPIVEQAERARVPENTARLLGRLGRRFAIVACVSGRSPTEARRLVGVGSLAYAGYHGAEVLMPGTLAPWQHPRFEQEADRVRRFALEHDAGSDLRLLRVRLEDKGPIFAFHWRGVPDEEAARARVEQVAAAAEAEGLRTHWGRKVLEVRPPVEIDKGQAVRRILDERPVTAALYAGDDRTDLDGFTALEELRAEGRLETALRIGIASDDGPPEIVERADLVADGVPGFAEILELLAGQP